MVQRFIDSLSVMASVCQLLEVSLANISINISCRHSALVAVSYRLMPEVGWQLYHFRTEIHSRIVPPRRLVIGKASSSIADEFFQPYWNNLELLYLSANYPRAIGPNCIA